MEAILYTYIMGRINLCEPIKANLQLGGTTVAGLLQERMKHGAFLGDGKQGPRVPVFSFDFSQTSAIAGIQQAILSCCVS